MMTIRQYLAERPGIAHAVTRIPMRPGTNPDADQWARDARHWVVEIRREGDGPVRRMSTFYSQGAAHKRPPTLAEVLDALAHDADGADQPFEEWAADLGYDPDSRQAKQTYRACRASAADLRRVLGPADYRVLLEEVERL